MGIHRKEQDGPKGKASVTGHGKPDGGDGRTSSGSPPSLRESGTDEEGDGGEGGYSVPNIKLTAWSAGPSKHTDGGLECPELGENDATTATTESDSTNTLESADDTHPGPIKQASETSHTPKSNPLKTGAESFDHVRRLWKRLRKVYRVQHLDEPCWEWTGAQSDTGYGSIWINGRTELTHKLAYYVFVGPIGNKHVCHKCDNRLCCNPGHHFLGTRSDNMKDAYKKGRLKNTFSTGSNSSKEKDREIKKNQILTMKEWGWPDKTIAERMQMTVEQVKTLAQA